MLWVFLVDDYDTLLLTASHGQNKSDIISHRAVCMGAKRCIRLFSYQNPSRSTILSRAFLSFKPLI